MSGAVSGTTGVAAAGEPTVELDGASPGRDSPPDTGVRLDDHHAPETNGRMAICRRCGTRTDSPAGGHHVPDRHQVARCVQWLDGQARANRVGRAREVLRA